MVLKMFFKSLSLLSNFLKRECENIEEIYTRLVKSMSYHHAYRNKLLFRFGQKADAFYISLKGRLAVLKPEEEKMDLTEEEYMRYLIKLKKNDEFEILNKCLEVNKKVYPITEYFDCWFDKRDLKYFGFSQAIMNDINEYLMILDMRLQQFEEDDTYETVEDYIAKSLPDKTKARHERKQVSIYVYHHVHNLESGSKFGELALQKPSLKRTATILTMDDCHLAIYTKKFFDDWFLKLNDSYIKGQINFFATLQIFSHMNKALFQRHYFYLFSKMSITRGDKIIIEGDDTEYIYFLREGDYELSLKRSIVELTDMVEMLSGVKKDMFENYFLSGILF
jgi:CRP-like cAMP-binding protein